MTNNGRGFMSDGDSFNVHPLPLLKLQINDGRYITTTQLCPSLELTPISANSRLYLRRLRLLKVACQLPFYVNTDSRVLGKRWLVLNIICPPASVGNIATLSFSNSSTMPAYSSALMTKLLPTSL